MLTLHYSLAYPEKKHISRPSPTLGTISDDTSATYQKYEQYLRKLKDFTPSGLTRQNQITRDMLLLYYQTQLSARDYTLLDEPLSPSLGIQAQLPVLLAEYAFYDDQDIADYLNLLTSVKPYFQSILTNERRRSDAGYFMSNATLKRILEQCSTFIKDPQNNYMLDVFARKLKDYGRFSEEDQTKLNERHKEILLTSVIPAYKEERNITVIFCSFRLVLISPSKKSSSGLLPSLQKTCTRSSRCSKSSHHSFENSRMLQK